MTIQLVIFLITATIAGLLIGWWLHAFLSTSAHKTGRYRQQTLDNYVRENTMLQSEIKEKSIRISELEKQGIDNHDLDDMRLQMNEYLEKYNNAQIKLDYAEQELKRFRSRKDERQIAYS